MENMFTFVNLVSIFRKIQLFCFIMAKLPPISLLELNNPSKTKSTFAVYFTDLLIFLSRREISEVELFIPKAN